MENRPVNILTLGLYRDRSGAIMVIGLLMAVFLVAVLYQVLGVGDAIWQRQRMQDAADSAALSAAVVHARGMNLLVLINLVMAALLAVVVALKVVETVCIAAIFLIGIASFFTGGALAASIPPLEEVRSSAHSAAETASDAVFPQLGALHAVARAVRVLVPAASEARVLDTVIGYYSPPARIGVALLPRTTLPVQDDRFALLCGKAAGGVGRLVAYPFETFGGAVGDLVGAAIGDASEGIGRSLSGWFCGSGEPSFDDLEVKYSEARPILPARVLCMQQTDPGRETAAEEAGGEEAEQRCEQARSDEEASAPDREGYCAYRGQAGEAEKCRWYWERARTARVNCDPNADDGLKDYQWQKSRIALRYRRQGGRWIPVRERIKAQLLRGDRPPCSRRRWNPTLGEADPERAAPVCSDREEAGCEPPPEQGDESGTDASEAVREGETTAPCYYNEVSQVFGCQKAGLKKSLSTKASEGDSLSEEEKQERERYLPQRIEPALELGGDDFQLRAVVAGQLRSGLTQVSERAIRAASWGRSRGGAEGIFREARKLGRCSVAQAEYYYAGGEEREDWMWKMQWRARLRRFRLPRESEAGESETGEEAAAAEAEPRCRQREASANADEAGGSDCDGMQGVVDLLDSLVVH